MYVAYSRRGTDIIDIIHISQNCVRVNEGVLVMFVAMCCFQFEYLSISGTGCRTSEGNLCCS